MKLILWQIHQKQVFEAISLVQITTHDGVYTFLRGHAPCMHAIVAGSTVMFQSEGGTMQHIVVNHVGLASVERDCITLLID